MDRPLHQAEKHHGLGDLGVLRHAIVQGGLVAWLLGGGWLLLQAAWPSTCTPEDLLELYACASRLPESGRWIEGALLTWLWSTPLLIALDLGRRLTGREEEDVAR